MDNIDMIMPEEWHDQGRVPRRLNWQQCAGWVREWREKLEAGISYQVIPEEAQDQESRTHKFPKGFCCES